MSTPSAIARSAPIAIASKKPTNGFNNLSARDKLSASMSSTTSIESATNTRSRKDRPCDACRRRKSRCVIHEGQTSCVLCQFHTQDCTFVQSPQPRKRKLNTEGKEESSAKRRYVQVWISHCSIPPFHSLAHVRRGVVANTFRYLDPQIDPTRDREGPRNPASRVTG